MERTRRAVLGSLAAGSAALAGCAAPTTGRERGGESIYTRVYNEVVPAVAVVHAAENDRKVGQGSGFALDPQTIITNHHVVAQGSEIDIGIADGRWSSATVVGSDTHSDLAVLSIDDNISAPETLPFVEEPQPVGTEVLAIGAPFGLSDSLSRGLISARGRSVQSLDRFGIPAAIQTDTEINVGSSGGPLVTLDGDVAGVVFASQGGNVGFAVSAALAKRVIPELRETGSYEHSYLGVTILTVEPQIAEANGLDEPRGVLVVETVDDGPSDGVLQPSLTGESAPGNTNVTAPPNGSTEPSDPPAIQQREIPTGGDIILSVNGTAVDSTAELGQVLALQTTPGDTIPLTVLRDGEETVVEVTLGTIPDR